MRPESLRDSVCTGLEWIYINVYGRITMVEDHKKSESEGESENKSLWRAIEDLQKRVRMLESEIMALQRGDNTGFRHPDDGGWFD